MRNLLIAVLVLSALGQARAEPSLTGADLFARNCQVCHGAEGLGDGPTAPFLDPRPRDLTLRPYKHGCGRGPIYRTITNGLPGTGMPSFGHLSEAEREALTDFVFRLSRQRGCGCKH